MDNYYKVITADEGHLYFDQELLNQFYESIAQQILAEPNVELAAGEGLYIFKDGSEKSDLEVAIQAVWVADLQVSPPEIKRLQVIKLHMFTGELPDEVLDAFNDITKRAGADAKPKWDYYD